MRKNQKETRSQSTVYFSNLTIWVADILPLRHFDRHFLKINIHSLILDFFPSDRFFQITNRPTTIFHIPHMSLGIDENCHSQSFLVLSQTYKNVSAFDFVLKKLPSGRVEASVPKLLLLFAG